MAGNILSAIIDVSAPGVEQEAKKASKAVNDMKVSLTGVQPAADGVTKSLSLLQKQVQAFGGGVNTFTSNFQKIPPALDQFDSKVKKTVKGTNEASFALLNFGRVAQDAPFGILGIANNLNPLFESLTRTNRATGGFSGTMKALGKSLIGPGGVGLAIGVVSSLLIVFGDKLFGASKKSKELDEANEKLAAGVASQAAKLTVLVGIVKNVESSYEDKNKALKAINQEYGKYLPNLDKEAVTLGNIDTAYKNIIDSLLRQAVVKGLQDEIAKAVEETAKKIIEVERAEQKRRMESEKTKATITSGLSAEKSLSNAIQQRDRVVSDATGTQQLHNAQLADTVNFNNSYEQVLKRTKAELFRTLEPLLKLTSNFEDLDIKLDKVKDKDIAIKPELLSPDVTKFINSLATTISSGKTFDIDGVLERSIQSIDTARLREIVNLQLFNVFDKEFAKFGQEPPDINVNIDPVINQQKLQTALDIIAERFNNAKTIAEGLSNAVGQTFDNIASGEDIVKSLVGAFKQLVVQIAKSVIQALVFNAIMNAILPGSSAAKGIGGIVGKFGGFRAGGGPVQAGRGYIVGENGPEWFQPNAGGTIIPSSQVGGAMAAVTGGDQQLVARVYGRDLLFILTQAAGASNRLS